MKLTFEGLYEDILDEMSAVLARTGRMVANLNPKINPESASEKPRTTAIPTNGSGQIEGPSPEADTQEDFFQEPTPKKTTKKAPKLEPDAGLLSTADKVKLRQSTVEDLQKAFGGGKQKEVLELLAKYGGGAKSFRELPIEAFIPIREAIDAGALT